MLTRFMVRIIGIMTQKMRFYPDWALPTFNISRVLVIVFAIVAVWPYLPGSGFQVFRGVSVFFGLVFSLTSVSAPSNFMAGLTHTYTRAFKLVDRVTKGLIIHTTLTIGYDIPRRKIHPLQCNPRWKYQCDSGGIQGIGL